MQNNNKCFVYLWDKLVGEMVLVRDKIYFKYDDKFKIEISPLELPIKKVQYGFNDLKYQHQYQIAGVFADSLPDSFGMKIIDSYFEEENKNFKPNIIDKLLFIGDVSLGALKYMPSIESLEKSNLSIELKNAKNYKKNILRENSYSSIREVIDMYKSFSPTGGAREKMILSYDAEDNIFYIREAKGNEISLILKIDESEIPNDGRDAITEYIYSIVARECEINIPKTYLFKDEDDYTHYAIERFDIDENGERLHAHTLAGLLHFEKSKRIDYTDVMSIAEQYLFLPHEDIVEIYRRMVFNYAYNNCDDHLKNHSFVMDKTGKWRLSPAYDLTYNNTRGQSDMVLNINQKLSTKANLIDFEEIALKFKITNYMSIIKQVENSYELYEKLINEMMNEKFKYDKLILLSTNKILQGNIDFSPIHEGNFEAETTEIKRPTSLKDVDCQKNNILLDTVENIKNTTEETQNPNNIQETEDEDIEDSIAP